MLATVVKSLLFFLVSLGYFLASGSVGANSIASSSLRLSDPEAIGQLEGLPGWKIENQGLHCTYPFKNFVEAIQFVDRLVEPAEKVSHHPDLSISYNQVTINLTTHDAGGLTQKDFDLARLISELAVQADTRCR